MDIQLIHGDCLELMKDIPDNSIDMILCDLPYGTTSCAWDVVIPFELLWKQYKRIIKIDGAIVLFGSQPFTTDLIQSNRKWFKYEWIWEKSHPTGFANSGYMPMKYHENILVFCETTTVFNPITWKGKNDHRSAEGALNNASSQPNMVYKYNSDNDGVKKPPSTLYFSCVNRTKLNHPTEKPVPLCEYLIRTYTNNGETVLDNTMGSGTTGVACIQTGRKFIGMELDEKYFNIAKRRIETAQLPLL